MLDVTEKKVEGTKLPFIDIPFKEGGE